MALDPGSLSPEVLGFLAERHLASLTTLRADGTPHVVPVGFAFEPEARLVRIITIAGSQKARNASGVAGRWCARSTAGAGWP